MTLFLRVGPPAPRTPVNGLRCYCDQTSQDVLRHSQILMRSITFLLRVLRAPQTFPFQLLRGPKKNTTREKNPTGTGTGRLWHPKKRSRVAEGPSLAKHLRNKCRL